MVAWCLTTSVFAGERATAPLLPAYQQECSGCHVAYPPELLPAQSWQRIMSRLSHHFGTDASVDAAQVKEISAWLAQPGVAPRRDTPPEDRITRSAWFAREHHEVPSIAWSHAAVKKASNCAACHTRADQGDFNERNVRISR